MKNSSINKIRLKLDKIDIKLLSLIKERSNLVDQVIKIKKSSIKAKIDPRITNSIWKAMIKAFIKYEYKNFKKK